MYGAAAAGARAARSSEPGRDLAALLLPGEELIAGRRPVEEAFAAGREAHRLLVVPQRREALEALVVHATLLRIPIVEVEGGTLTSLAGFDGHQGVALAAAPRPAASIDDVLARSIARGEPPLVLVLDSLEDPQNVGSLLRSAEACGVHGIVYSTHRAAPITPAVVKTSAGAVEHLLLVPVDDLPGMLADLRIHGLRIVGTDAEAPLSYREADLRGPLALVVGSEGHGLGAAVRRRLDFSVRIPMRGRVGSLNAAVAGSILLFEATAQRPPGGDAGAVSAATDSAAPESVPAVPEPASDEPPAPDELPVPPAPAAPDELPANAAPPDDASPDAPPEVPPAPLPADPPAAKRTKKKPPAQDLLPE